MQTYSGWGHSSLTAEITHAPLYISSTPVKTTEGGKVSVGLLLDSSFTQSDPIKTTQTLTLDKYGKPGNCGPISVKKKIWECGSECTKTQDKSLAHKTGMVHTCNPSTRKEGVRNLGLPSTTKQV